MTYCAGWKYKNAVFLLADTAATKSIKPQGDYSSFGQLQAEVRGEYVEESLLKLVPLGPGTVAALSGDVELATRCLDFLRDNLAAAPSTADLLASLSVNLGPFPSDPERAVGLLLARTFESGESELLHWDTARGLDRTGADYYHIGSLNSYHSALTPELLARLAAGNVDADRMLPVAVAIVQSYGVHDDLVSMNVGGLIFGVQTKLGSVSWMQDTNFVLYDASFTYKAIITAIARDDTLVVSSSISDGIRVFGHSTSTPRPEELWTPDWLRNVRAIIDSGKTPLWVFISTEGRLITLIFRSDTEADSRYVQLTNLGGGAFDLAISRELMALLTQPLVDRNDGSLPFRLNVRSD